MEFYIIILHNILLKNCSYIVYCSTFDNKKTHNYKEVKLTSKEYNPMYENLYFYVWGGCVFFRLRC